jgi:formate hydrogenlyase regulatory protein HycA
MAIPERIPIAYEPDYYTRYIGKTKDGRQFMAFVVATEGKGKPWYAVLHTFDADGNHLDTEAWLAGTTAKGEQEACELAQKKRLEMLAGLGKYKLCKIKVKLFSVKIDGHLFGLVDSSEPEEGPEFAERVTLWPNDLLFTPPWNGTYST